MGHLSLHIQAPTCAAQAALREVRLHSTSTSSCAGFCQWYRAWKSRGARARAQGSCSPEGSKGTRYKGDHDTADDMETDYNMDCAGAGAGAVSLTQHQT
jgi:hypothetical protein